MATLKLTYNSINQIIMYFKSLENAPSLTFGQRRGLARLNEALEKEFKAFSSEITGLADKFCEKDDNGNIVIMENGGQKIKDGMVEAANQALIEIHSTETEIEYMPFKLPDYFFDQLQCSKETFELIENNFIM